MTDATAKQHSPYQLLGGHAGVARIVDRFYDLMESDPAYAELRAMHQPDLTPMRRSLTGFLGAWFGGPRQWFVENPGKCMMSMHRGIAITASSAEQWTGAMARALADCSINEDLAARINGALAGMAANMVRSC